MEGRPPGHPPSGHTPRLPSAPSRQRPIELRQRKDRPARAGRSGPSSPRAVQLPFREGGEGGTSMPLREPRADGLTPRSCRNRNESGPPQPQERHAGRHGRSSRVPMSRTSRKERVRRQATHGRKVQRPPPLRRWRGPARKPVIIDHHDGVTDSVEFPDGFLGGESLLLPLEGKWHPDTGQGGDSRGFCMNGKGGRRNDVVTPPRPPQRNTEEAPVTVLPNSSSMERKPSPGSPSGTVMISETTEEASVTRDRC